MQACAHRPQSDQQHDLEGGDYHLTATSAAVASGENLSSVFVDDFDENPRGDGAFDMGAYGY